MNAKTWVMRVYVSDILILHEFVVSKIFTGVTKTALNVRLLNSNFNLVSVVLGVASLL